MNGTSITLLTADSAEISGLNISRFGLTASQMDVNSLSIYTTSISGQSSALGGALQITGNQKINQGPIATATFSNITIGVARMEGNSANMTNMASIGAYVGGNEPYVPNILSALEGFISKTYSITGPVTYGHLVNTSSKIVLGEVQISQFSFAHPASYNLNRTTKVYTATNVWQWKAPTATATNVTAYMIYFKVSAAQMITMTVTGEERIDQVIAHGYDSGQSFDCENFIVNAVYFTSSHLTMNDFVLSIEPSSAGSNPAQSNPNQMQSNLSQLQSSAISSICLVMSGLIAPLCTRLPSSYEVRRSMIELRLSCATTSPYRTGH